MAGTRRPVIVAMVVVVLAIVATGVGVSSASATTTSAFSQTETISRTNEVPGGNDVVDTRTVTLNVSQTNNLQGRQEVHVSWTGAHPTGGIVADQNSIGAQLEEYPVVLLECRGVASGSSQVSPQTCWTQTWSEHYQDSLGDQYPPYRIDRYASATPQPAIVGAPSPLPKTCNGYETAPVQDWVPFVAANGTVYPGGNAHCAGEPPESDDSGGAALPSNETFGVTGTDGTGSANFDIDTKAENASLGCSQTVACSLVAVPIMGISCLDTASVPASDISQCQETGAFQPGAAPNGQQTPDLTVAGSLWWAPSNWRNRITVPLTFATPSDVCSVTGSAANNVIDIYGSELMIQATSQWEPNFCLDPKLHFSFIHVQTGEPQARNLVASGTAEAAFTSDGQPGGYGKPVVNAPVAATGFAISYDIDGANGVPYTSLKLTPLLLAKLLTESYPGDLFLKNADPTAFANSPLNITMDPEFTALNPGVAPDPAGSDEPAAELIALSSDSDVMEALTSYINADPTARAWLNGTPDAASGGMTVNPAYKGIQLPVNQWPLLSTFVPSSYYATGLNACLHDDPVPYQPLVAAPEANLESISESIQYALPNSTTVCSQPNEGSSLGEKLVTSGRQTPGHRFMIGITPLADTQRYLLQTAALQTTTGTFVAPTNASLQAATSLLTPDATSGTWPIPYASFEQSAGASAYPGTMLVYAAIPTTGLPPADATDYASFLSFAATTGQTVGSGVGQLPPGYLPLTAADGLGGLAQYTLDAATDVAAQNGQVPSMTAVASPGPSPSEPSDQGPFGEGSLDYSSSGVPYGASGTSSSSAAAGIHRVLPVDRTSFRLVHPGAAVGTTLWTGSSIMVLVLALALLGVLGIPALFALGKAAGTVVIGVVPAGEAAGGPDEAELPSDGTTDDAADVEPELTGPPRPGAIQLVLAVAMVFSVAALFLGVFAFGLSGLQEQRSQHLLYANFRGLLDPSSPVAPGIGGKIPAGTPVALISAPGAGLDQVVVVEGTTSSDLLAGPGHRSNSPLPGQRGVSVLIGKSATAGAPFAGIARLHRGQVVTVRTGEGPFRYTVAGQVAAGHALPTFRSNSSLLVLVTSAGTGWAGALTSDHLVYVVAKLDGKSVGTPAGRVKTVPAAAIQGHNDPSGWPIVLLWLVVLAGVSALCWRAWYRWGLLRTWLLGAPVLLAVLWIFGNATMRLVPNVY